MIRGLDSFLRKIFVIFGVLFLLSELMPQKKMSQSDKEGFDNEEFDDIW